MRKKEFIIDYEVVGILALSCRNIHAAKWRSRALIDRAIQDLKEIGIHCEAEVNEPIDCQERYGDSNNMRKDS